MTLDLYRVDERLLHGQVVVGWGERLDVDYYVVVDAELAASEWEQDLYLSSVPAGVEVIFLDPDAPAEELRDAREREGVGCLLTRGTAAMRRLAERGFLDGATVNVGCLRAGRDRDLRVTDYVHLSAGERADLRAVAERAGEVECRDLPDSRPVPVEPRLEEAEPAAGGSEA